MKEIVKRMKNFSKNKLIVMIVVLILLIIGISYALISFAFKGEKYQSISLGGLSFSLEEQVNGLTLLNVDPLNDEDGLSSGNDFTFKVTATGKRNQTIRYYIYLSVDEENTMPMDYISLKLYNLTKQEEGAVSKVSFLENKDINEYYLYNDSITLDKEKEVENNYKLIFFVNEDYEATRIEKEENKTQVTVVGGETFKFKINVATGEAPIGEGLSQSWSEKTTNEASYLALYTVDKVTLPETYSYNNETYSKTKEIDVSSKRNETVLLGEYTLNDKIIAVIGQDGGVVAPENSRELFSNLSSLESIDLSNLDTSNVRSMAYMFSNSSNLESIDLTNFNTRKVSDMSYMFNGLNKITSLDLTFFNTRKINLIQGMFNACSSLTEVLAGCSWIIDSNAVTTSMYNGTSLSNVTRTCSGEQEEGTLASDWKDYTTNEASYLALYTYNSKSLPATYNYNGTTYTLSTTIDVSEETNGNVVLGEYKNSAGNIIALIGQGGKVIAPAISSKLFQGLAQVRTMDLSNFDTSNVTTMLQMFQNCANLTELDLKSFDTSKVTSMQTMFGGCKAVISIDLTTFDTSKVTDMTSMFYYCESLNTVIVGCNWQKAATATDWFSKAAISSVTKVCEE